MNSSERSKSAINAQGASLSRVRRQIDSVTALREADAQRASKRRARIMTELTENEIIRRQKISASRKAGHNGSGDGGKAATAARIGKSRAFAESVYPVIREIADTYEMLNFSAIADDLNKQQIAAPRGGPWAATQVKRIWLIFNPQQ